MTKPDTYATAYIPPHAITCWVDDSYVYTTVPCKSGPPLIQRYPLTEGGLSKALNFLRVQPRQKLGSTRPQPFVSPTIRRELGAKDRFTDSQREKTRMVLRKMGII